MSYRLTTVWAMRFIPLLTPAEFDLSFDTGLTLRKCCIAWQTLTNVGVSFEQPAGR